MVQNCLADPTQSMVIDATSSKGSLHQRKSCRDLPEALFWSVIAVLNGMLILSVLIQMLSLTAAGREHGVLHRTGSELTVILQLRTHAGRVRCYSVKMHFRLEISSEIIKWQRQAMEQFTVKDVGALEDLKLSVSQQCCASTKTATIFHCINRKVLCEAWSKPATLQVNYKASAGIFYLFWALHFRKDVSQLDKAQKRVARMMGDVENMACGQILRDQGCLP